MNDTNEMFSTPERFHEELAKIQGTETETPNNEAGSDNDDIQTKEEATLSSEVEEGGEDVDATPEDSDTDGDEAPEKTNFIPKSRFNKEIEKRKALEEQLHQERESKIRFETQLEMMRQMQESKASQPTPEPQADPLDPLDMDAHNLYMQKIQALEKRLENFNQESTQKTQQLHYYNMVSAQEQTFEKQNPDFKDALEHLKTVEMQVAKNFYNEEQAESYVAQKMQNALMAAINSGKNTAEVMYSMAKSYGYAPKSAQKAPSGSNLGAINNNMKKSASIQSLGNSVGMGNNSSGFDISQTLRDPKNPSSGIDNVKFQKHMARIMRNA